MGSALAEGAVAARAISAGRVSVFDPDLAARRTARRLRLTLAASEADAAAKSDLVFLCVKPQQMGPTLDRIAALPAADLKRRCFVSIAAGVPIERIERRLGAGTPVLRVMPNTPALLRAGASAVSRGRHATARHEKWVKTVLGAVGDVFSVDETGMDAVTAVSGSGPAYLFYVAEAMTEAAVSLGLESALARKLVRQTIFGAGVMLRERKEDASELRAQVTSPGGTTAAAIAVFDREQLKSKIVSALRAAAERSAELARL
jgi:pyrroline-5-carboxylate reductase